MKTFLKNCVFCGTCTILLIQLVSAQSERFDNAVISGLQTVQSALDDYDYFQQSKIPESIKKTADKQSAAFDNGVDQIASGNAVEGLSSIAESELGYYTNGLYTEHTGHAANHFLAYRVWPLDWLASFEIVARPAKLAHQTLIWWTLVSTLIVVVVNPRNPWAQPILFLLLFAAFCISLTVGGASGLLAGSQWGFFGQILGIPIGVIGALTVVVTPMIAQLGFAGWLHEADSRHSAEKAIFFQS